MSSRRSVTISLRDLRVAKLEKKQRISPCSKELDAYLASRKAGAEIVKKFEPAKLKSWREFVKKTFPKQIRDKAAFTALEYKDGKWVKSEGPSGGKSTSFFN